MLREVHKRFLPLERKTSPLTVKATDLPTRLHWVEPKLVTGIRFGEWTRDRHVRQSGVPGFA
jgi:ATP-dependent DNA ligase